MTWRCSHKIDEVLLDWNDEQHAVFFNPATGDTHLVSALAGLVAEVLGDQTLDLPTLLDGLRPSLDGPDDPALEASLADHLQLLTRIGLLQEIRA